MELKFENMSRYSSFQALIADTPEQLAAIIRSITTPFQILGFSTTSGGQKQVAYVVGDFKIKQKQTNKKGPSNG